MKEHYIDDILKKLEDEFDIHSPEKDHQARFLEKLHKAQTHSSEDSKGKNSFWKPLLFAAASLIIGLGIFSTIDSNQANYDLASVSPQLSETQDFFTNTIAEELKKLDAEQSPMTKDIIYDALREISTLEKAYAKLKIDLKESGEDQRVIYAMISNFQSRIDILTNVLEHIENIKQLKNKPNDTEITI